MSLAQLGITLSPQYSMCFTGKNVLNPSCASSDILNYFECKKRKTIQIVTPVGGKSFMVFSLLGITYSLHSMRYIIKRQPNPFKLLACVLQIFLFTLNAMRSHTKSSQVNVMIDNNSNDEKDRL